MAVKYVCLEHVTLSELAEQGLFPVSQIRHQNALWVGIDPNIADATLQSKLATLGFKTLEWQQDGEVWLLKTAREVSQDDIKPLKPKFSTTIRSWLGTTNAAFRDGLIQLVNQILVPAVGRDVNIWVPHNRTREPIYGPEFNIFVWASPTPVDENWTAPERVFGRSTARMDHRFGKWAEGTPILTQEGDEIGAIDGNNLFIYADLVHNGNELPIWRPLLLEAVKVLATTDETFDRSAAKNLYVDLCSKRLVQQIRMAETALAATRQEADEASKTLAAKLRAVDRITSELNSMSVAAASGKSKFEQEFESLLAIPKIKAVAFRGSMLVISTDILRAKNPATGGVHEIGKFKFITDTERGTVKILNQTRVVNAYRPRMQAPHVFPDGRPCLGNLEATVPQLVAGYEFSALAQILIAYIESVNLDDGAGRYIERWPRILGDGSLRTPDNGMHEIKVLSIEDMREQTKAALERLKAEAAKEAAKEPAKDTASAKPAAAVAAAVEEAAEEVAEAAPGDPQLRDIVTDPTQWHEEAIN